MITVRWIERLWNAGNHGKLACELLQNRPEGMVDCMSSGRCASDAMTVKAAALALIRLDELSQSSAAVSRQLLGVIIKRQQSDGGWGELFTSALCTRALLCGQGNGVAIDRAMEFFSLLQKPEGIWPREPLRRMPADGLVSALILLEIGDNSRFRSAVCLSTAMQWFELHADQLDPETRLIWSHARLRCGSQRTRALVTLLS